MLAVHVTSDSETTSAYWSRDLTAPLESINTTSQTLWLVKYEDLKCYII